MVGEIAVETKKNLNEGDRILNSDLEIDKNRILIGSRTTYVDYPPMDDKEAIPLRSYDRMKQEEVNV